MHVVEYPTRLSADAAVERALSQAGRRGYHLIFDNCEHFACWCVVGRDESRQVTVACERLSAAGVKTFVAGTARVTSKIGTKRLVGATPWMLIADAMQWITEAGGHHVGLRDPQHRKNAGPAVGITTALGVGACAGPVGAVVSGGLWAAGELAGEISRGHLRADSSTSEGPVCCRSRAVQRVSQRDRDIRLIRSQNHARERVRRKEQQRVHGNRASFTRVVVPVSRIVVCVG